MEDPIDKFTHWLNEAKSNKAIIEPTAMTVATATAAGKPSARILLLKSHDKRGFVFFTNLESRKSDEIKANPFAALCFYWMALDKQIRIEGKIEPASDAEADAYFASRHRESRIGAWSSKQSRPLSSREELMQAVSENTKKFEGQDVPRPPFWSGWRVVPEVIEFWQQNDFRLHDREIYTRIFTSTSEAWKTSKLYP